MGALSFLAAIAVPAGPDAMSKSIFASIQRAFLCPLQQGIHHCLLNTVQRGAARQLQGRQEFSEMPRRVH